VAWSKIISRAKRGIRNAPIHARTALNQHEGNEEADSHEGELDPIEQLRTSGQTLADSFISVRIDAEQRLTQSEPQSEPDSDNAHFDGEIKEDP
jgi:hypothetical protein